MTEGEAPQAGNRSSAGAGVYDVIFQVGGPDVASEETIETSVIVEVGEQGEVAEVEEVEEEGNTSTTSDHCYTFKRGIRPKVRQHLEPPLTPLSSRTWTRPRPRRRCWGRGEAPTSTPTSSPRTQAHRSSSPHR